MSDPYVVTTKYDSVTFSVHHDLEAYLLSGNDPPDPALNSVTITVDDSGVGRGTVNGIDVMVIKVKE